MTDLVQLELIRESLIAVVGEMRANIIHSSYAAIIYEGHDFSCALMSADGRQIALPLALQLGGVDAKSAALFVLAVLAAGATAEAEQQPGAAKEGNVCHCRPFYRPCPDRASGWVKIL